MKSNKTLTISIILAFILRLALSVVPGFKIDTDAWFSWALRLNEVEFSKFYSTDIWTNYTPGYFYILWFLGFLQKLFSLPSELFYLLLKIPPILADLILAIIIYHITSRYSSKKLATFLTIAILFNPAIIFNSTIWGQIDGLLTIFIVLAIDFLVKKKYVLSSIAYAIAFLIKPQALALLPIYFLYLIKNRQPRIFAQIILPGCILLFLLSLPFFTHDPLLGFYKLILQMSGDYSVNSLFAYNLWGTLGFWINDTETFGLFSYHVWGILMITISWIYASYLYLRKNINLYLLATIACLFFFFLPTRVHERYLYPALPFLLISLVFVKNKTYLILLTLLNITYFLNLYYVYHYYNYNYLNLTPYLSLPILYQFLEQNSKLLSTISSFCFILIFFLLSKFSYDKNNKVAK